MPRQETFFSSIVAGTTIKVVKTYDREFARQAFSHMDDAALDHLTAALGLGSNYEEVDIPARTDPDYADLLWDEIVESAREDGTLFSFFVVIQSKHNVEEELFVSPDWPTAEAYVNLISNRAPVSEAR
jgi:hypothetical protein